MKRRLDISTNYSCDICEFKTKKQSNLLRHLNTDKHIRNERISLDYEENEDCQDLIDHEGEISLCQASEYNVSPRPAPPLSASHEDDGHSDHDDLPVEFACSTYDTDSVYYEETEDAPYNSSTEWFPFPSKLDMLLYILLHSKTHILSDETIRFVWFIMHEVGINMPSITSIKKMSFGNLTAESLLHHSEDQDGTPFWFIKPSSLLKLAISHPETSDKLIRYGRFSSTDTTTHIKEQADGNKWKQEMKGSSAKKAYTIFYAGDFVVNKRTNRIGKIENFLQNNEEKQQLIKSSPFKKNNNMVVSLPVNMFLDDTSANKSKKWKPLHCIQLQLSGLPVSERQNANTVKFIAASSVVSILDMMRAIIDDLQEVKRNGIQIYDARENEVVTVTTELALCVCDFCMMAEATNHMGATTNKFCPRCDADRSTCLYKGAERNPADTRRVLQRLAIINSKEIRQRYGLKPYANCLWDIINPHKDIPVGMLHWMFLGLGKHLLKLCISDLDQNQQEKLELLIESADQSSFVSKISRDMIKFIDSRQGKDIKSYIQIAPFHMKIAGLPNNRVNLLCKLAEICKMMVTKTEYFEDDLQCLNQMITDYLQTVKDEFPTILQKVKTHLSTHIVDDILHHGPPSAYQEDAFEKMHGRIRDQLFIQNQHAKSRDTSYSFAEMEILLHVTTGGYFMNLGEWVQATNNVLQTAKKNEVRDYLGLKRCEIKPKNILQKAKRSDNKKVVRNTISDDLDDLIGACNKLSNDLTINTQHCKTAIFKAVNCAVGEVANSGNPVLYLDVNDHNKECIGIFIEGFEIQSDHGDNIYMVKIQKMNRKDSSSQLGFSCDRVELSKAYIYVKATSVIQSVCLVHDCLSGFCYLKHRPQSVKIEQEFKEVNKLFWVHRENHHVYFVNRFRFSHEKLLQSKE